MRANEFITELRKNPDQNPKVYPYKRVRIRAKAEPGNTFVSMTEIDKIGINPKSTYQTPFGIYSYPAEYVVKKGARTLDDLPFEGDQPYVNIFNGQGNIVELSSMQEQQYQQWAKYLADYFANTWRDRKLYDYPNASTAWKAGADIAEEIIENAAAGAKFGARPGGRFWSITMEMAKKLHTGSVPIAWNALFRGLNIDGCVDHGDGIIHTSERNQAVFFSTGAITNVERLLNKYSPKALDKGRAAGEIIQDIKHKMVQMDRAALLQHLENKPFDIQWLKNPPEEAVLHTVNRNPTAIDFVKRPSLAAQKIVMAANPRFYHYINNPHPDITAMHQQGGT